MSLVLRSGILAFGLSLTTSAYAQESVKLPYGSAPEDRVLAAGLFHADTGGWTVTADMTGLTLNASRQFFSITNDNEQVWLSATTSQEDTLVVFSLKTDYKDAPLAVAVPVAMLNSQRDRKLLLRYRKNSLDLYLNGVLVDQEWPLGAIDTGGHPTLHAGADHPALTIFGKAVPDSLIEKENGGAKAVAARSNLILGPQPEFIQYSRPRGWNTNAGDAMPYFHDGVFHLYFLQDRRQHHSKWGLGAHQWAHISSTDLVHWTNYPIALGIDSDWEGSICTGSVFFNGGTYYAFYATRMKDRSEHLAVGMGSDPVLFKKLLPTPFAEPQPPYVHGPNRDPFVFEAEGKFHMLVTAALPAANGETEGALEHLTSTNLKDWRVEPEPFLRVGTKEQPECSDLFEWKGWYYLLYSLSGTTHYELSRSPLGPWEKPVNDILDGPEAIVMKAAPFSGGRFLSVGFVQHDNMYGGDLVFRELVQERDGKLGSKFPSEMVHPAIAAPARSSDLHSSADQSHAATIPVDRNVQLTATLDAKSASSFELVLRSQNVVTEVLRFDPANRAVGWETAAGKAEHAVLHDVADLAGPLSLTLVIHDTIADVMLNGHRTLVHRLLQRPEALEFKADSGEAEMTNILRTAIR